jgi:hypothetical protein
VRAILAAHSRPPVKRTAPVADREDELVERGAALLRAAVDYDGLVMQGQAPARALETMRGAGKRHDDAVLAALTAVVVERDERGEIREVALRALKPGMILAEDVKTNAGMLLAANGYEIRATFIERLLNYKPGTVKEPVLILVPRA